MLQGQFANNEMAISVVFRQKRPRERTQDAGAPHRRIKQERMGRQLVAVDLDVQSAEAVDEDVHRCREGGRIVVESPLPTRSCAVKRGHDGRVSWFHHEDGGITASLVHRLVTFEDFRFGKRVGRVRTGVNGVAGCDLLGHGSQFTSSRGVTCDCCVVDAYIGAFNIAFASVAGGGFFILTSPLFNGVSDYIFTLFEGSRTRGTSSSVLDGVS